jgi:hypothetical protein
MSSPKEGTTKPKFGRRIVVAPKKQSPVSQINADLTTDLQLKEGAFTPKQIDANKSKERLKDKTLGKE